MTPAGECMLKFYFLFWALADYTGEANHIFDPKGIVMDERGSNRESIRQEFREGMVERTTCEMHFYDSTHKVAKTTWSSQSRKKFVTTIHGNYTAKVEFDLSRNARRSIKNDILPQVAEHHVVESPTLQEKLKR